MRQRQPRIHDDAHLAFVRQLPCLSCGDDTSTEAAHVKYSCDRAAKRSIGAGEKADDCWTVPLCGKCHRIQHAMNEVLFWKDRRIDPIFVCLALSNASGDFARGSLIVAMSAMPAHTE